jgi:hypothetical protein
VEIAPPLPEAERNALSHALERAGVRLDGLPEAYASPWRRAAAREAVDNQPARAQSRYAPSPRSTRGATRA